MSEDQCISNLFTQIVLSRNKTEICTVGFEPNPSHSDMLKSIEVVSCDTDLALHPDPNRDRAIYWIPDEQLGAEKTPLLCSARQLDRDK